MAAFSLSDQKNERWNPFDGRNDEEVGKNDHFLGQNEKVVSGKCQSSNWLWLEAKIDEMGRSDTKWTTFEWTLTYEGKWPIGTHFGCFLNFSGKREQKGGPLAFSKMNDEMGMTLTGTSPLRHNGWTRCANGLKWMGEEDNFILGMGWQLDIFS